jgi:predicted nucleic acid-binding protein
MSLYYFDTSALVKYYVTEPGSTWVRQLVDQTYADTGQPVNTIFITEISLVEVASALAILNRVGRITRRDRDRAYRNFMNDAWRLFDLLSLVTADFLTAAGLTQRHPLRAYDAIQLTVALRRNALLTQAKLALIFVSGDKQQLTAAEIEGLTVEDPFNHLSSADILPSA